ncbi:MAG TPA: CpsD/CapB family tyrosine-protein kinase [Bryobacteraceae bacterium]|jgi:receptor protein-tyrosine kinase
MSRVHDALRKATQDNPLPSKAAAPRLPRIPSEAGLDLASPPSAIAVYARETVILADASTAPGESGPGNMEECIKNARQVTFHPLSDALLVNPDKPREAPAEEFRTLRTRLNHLQTLQPLHTLVVTSASPAEGKSFTAVNLALTQAQLANKRILLADFDFRRPTVDKTFQIPVSPGMTNYLQGKASFGEVITRLGDSNLYIITAGDAVSNPLELLNLKECVDLIDQLRNHFDWVILDSPPLLFAADGNLLATMCDGTVLVVRIGTTTFDSVNRALQSLCENNVIGIVVNGARRGELYSKYSYYHDYYSYDSDGQPKAEVEAEPTVEGDQPQDSSSLLAK